MEKIIIDIINAFEYDFIQNALIAGLFIAITCSILGVFLVLKNMSLIGDGLAHVSFAAIAIGLLFSKEALTFSIPLVIFSSIVILKLKEKAKINADSSIGMLSAFSIAVGVIIASLANGFNIDIQTYLFGSILFITNLEVYLSIILSIVVILIVILNYHDLFSITFDEEFAKTSNIKVERINIILSILTSVAVVLGIRVVGTMLISSLIVFPAVTALLFLKGFKATIIISATFATTSVVLGVILSYIMNLPTGATIVIFNALFFTISFFIKKFA